MRAPRSRSTSPAGRARSRVSTPGERCRTIWEGEGTRLRTGPIRTRCVLGRAVEELLHALAECIPGGDIERNEIEHKSSKRARHGFRHRYRPLEAPRANLSRRISRITFCSGEVVNRRPTFPSVSFASSFSRCATFSLAASRSFTSSLFACDHDTRVTDIASSAVFTQRPSVPSPTTEAGPASDHPSALSRLPGSAWACARCGEPRPRPSARRACRSSLSRRMVHEYGAGDELWQRCSRGSPPVLRASARVAGPNLSVPGKLEIAKRSSEQCAIDHRLHGTFARLRPPKTCSLLDLMTNRRWQSQQQARCSRPQCESRPFYYAAPPPCIHTSPTPETGLPSPFDQPSPQPACRGGSPPPPARAPPL